MKYKHSFLLFSTICLSACSSDYTKEDPKTEPIEDRRTKGMGKFFGDDFLTFGGTKKKDQENTGLGVNSYLWRAALDTISFMPISSADPFGGVILTDWYSPPQTPQERLKINIFILDRQLRSDGVKVSVFRQEREGGGPWIDQSVCPETIKDLENAILTRARNFKVKTIK